MWATCGHKSDQLRRNLVELGHLCFDVGHGLGKFGPNLAKFDKTWPAWAATWSTWVKHTWPKPKATNVGEIGQNLTKFGREVARIATVAGRS